jgi:hypothetical protein
MKSARSDAPAPDFEKAKAILEALGIAEAAKSNHEFLQMAGNVVYLSEQLGVKTGYRWELR